MSYARSVRALYDYYLVPEERPLGPILRSARLPHGELKAVAALTIEGINSENLLCQFS